MSDNSALRERMKTLESKLQSKESDLLSAMEEKRKDTFEVHQFAKEESKKVSELHNIISQNQKFMEVRDREIEGLKMEIKDLEDQVKSIISDKHRSEYDLGNQIYRLETEIKQKQGQLLESGSSFNKLLEKALREKDTTEKRLRNEKDKYADSQLRNEKKILKLKGDISELDKEVSYLRKTNSDLEKMLTKEKMNSKIEGRGQAELTDILNQSVELIDEILKFSKSERSLSHVFKAFNSRFKTIEKSVKKLRRENAQYLKTGHASRERQKRSIIDKGCVSTRRVSKLTVAGLDDRKTSKNRSLNRSRVSSRKSSVGSVSTPKKTISKSKRSGTPLKNPIGKVQSRNGSKKHSRKSSKKFKDVNESDSAYSETDDLGFSIANSSILNKKLSKLSGIRKVKSPSINSPLTDLGNDIAEIALDSQVPRFKNNIVRCAQLESLRKESYEFVESRHNPYESHESPRANNSINSANPIMIIKYKSQAENQESIESGSLQSKTLKQTIRDCEDELIRLKKNYKDRLSAESSNMQSEDIAKLRSELSAFMIEIEAKSTNLLNLRKELRKQT